MKGKNPVLQHYVPKFYLKYFCIPETQKLKTQQVWAFSRNHGTPFKTSIKGLAAQRYLYSPENSDGEREWETEIKLSNLESLLGSVWDKLANNLFDFENHIYIQKALALFISTMYLRNPKRTIDIRNVHQEIYGQFSQFSKTFNGFFLQSEFKNFEVMPENELKKFFVKSINNHAINLAELLLEKRWSILSTKTPLFITSDNPVVIVNFEKKIMGLIRKEQLYYFH